MRPRTPRTRLALAAALGLALAHLPAGQADVVVFRDGFTVHGTYVQEKETFQDPNSGEVLKIRRTGALTGVDDVVRLVVFSSRPNLLSDLDKKTNVYASHKVYSPGFSMSPSIKLPAGGRVEGFGEWTNKWTRVVSLQANDGRHNVEMQLTHLSPHYLRTSGRLYQWICLYRTNEFEPEYLRGLLVTLFDVDKKYKTLTPVDRHMNLFEFFFQAGWLDHAERELAEVPPTEKKRVDEARERVRKARIDRLGEDVEAARAAGRHEWAQQAVKKFPREGVDANLGAKLATMEAQYETSSTQLKQALRYLDELPKQLPAGSYPFLAEAATAIRSELHLDTFTRLETFATLAEQAERDRKAGRAATGKPEELLSLAVTGWLLGKSASEAKVPVAERLWHTRKLALAYLNEDQPGTRKKALGQYLQSENRVEFDVLAQLASLLPPPAAEPNFRTDQALRLTAPPTRMYREGLEYLVQLPPEYQHSRPYPLLVALQDTNEKAEAMLQRLKDQAARHGYVLVAPRWAPIATEYGWTPAEHEAILQLIRDVKRRFQVDSDRVFLTGLGEGGTMALDVGASHPDLFAGLLPVNPKPRWDFMGEYWRNVQYLPTYLVSGGLTGNGAMIQLMISEWVAKGYPAITVIYKGRVSEWFPGEVPTMFDWMNRKKRVHGYPALGSPEEFRALRPSENRFYWLSTDEIHEKHLVPDGEKRGRGQIGAYFAGSIKDGNNIQVRTLGLRNVTVWLARGMVDFEKPINLTVNARGRAMKTTVKPSVEILMEDLFERADRQKLFLAKLIVDRP